MRNSTLSIFTIGLIALILGSCSTSSDLTDTSVLKKRRYMKGYQVNIKGNNKDKKVNSITAEMESVENRPTMGIPTDDMAQASLSGEITEADLAPSPIITSANEVATDNKSIMSKKAERKMNVAFAKAQSKTADNLTERKASKKDRVNSSVPVSGTAVVASGGESLVLYVILAIILPPLAVGLLYGIGTEFLISLLLTLIFWVPGVIYALIKVFQKH